MTRGFIVLASGKKIIRAAEINSDAYLSHCGVQILDAFEKDTVSEFIDNELRSKWLDTTDLADFTWDWVIRSKDNGDNFFLDYSYVCDIKKNTLTVYYFGENLLTVHHEDIPLYRFIFEKDNELYRALSWDEEKWAHVKDYRKELKKLLKNLQGETSESMLAIFKALIDGYQDPLFVMPDLRYKDVSRCWYGKDMYRVHIASGDHSNCGFEIFVMKAYGTIDAVVQLPWCRRLLLKASSFQKMNNAITNLVRHNQNELAALVPIYKLYDSYYNDINALYSQCTSANELTDIQERISALTKNTVEKANSLYEGVRVIFPEFDRENFIGQVHLLKHKISTHALEEIGSTAEDKK